MKYRPKISIIIPNFNCEKFIERSIQSILTQTFNEFELIIVDDASNDNSIENILKFLSDDRVRLIELKKNIGNFGARNIGIDASRGQFIAAMDSDDIAARDRLALQFDAIKSGTYACVGSQGYLIDENDVIIKNINRPVDSELLKISLLKDNFILHSSLLFNRKILEKEQIIGYNTYYHFSSDYDFVSKCSFRFKISNLSERLVYYRAHTNQISKKNKNSQTSYAREIRISILKELGIVPDKDEEYFYNSLMEGKLIPRNRLSIIQTFLEKILKTNYLNNIYNQDMLFDFFQGLLSQAYTISINTSEKAQ